MSKTIAEMQDWLLQTDVNKVILVEIDNLFFYSSKPYIHGSINYDPCINGGISYTEKLNIEGSPSISYGSIELDNTNGSLDTLLTNTYWWKNKDILIYLGDITWPRDYFSLIFKGTTSDISVPDRNKIAFSITDRMAVFNASVSDKLLGYTGSNGYSASGGTGAIGPTNITNYLASGYFASNIPILEANLNTMRPILLGECFNVTPLEVAASNPDIDNPLYNGQLYMVHDGPIERIIEVRDNGAPIGYIEYNEWGMFALENSSYGTITASVQGYIGSKANSGYTGSVGSYTDTVAGVIKLLLTNYGTEAGRAVEADFDFPSPDDTPYVGVYLTDKENLLDTCNKVAQSGGYNLICPTIDTSDINVASSEGKFKLIPINLLNAISTDYTFTQEDFISNSMTISEVFPIVPAYKIGYCKNWTVQEKTNLAEALVPESVGYFTSEYLFNRFLNEGAQNDLKDYSEPTEQDILLLSGTHARAELERQHVLRIQRRYVVKAQFLPNFIYTEIGDTAKFMLDNTNARFYSIIHNRVGRIYEIERNWLTGVVTMGILV